MRKVSLPYIVVNPVLSDMSITDTIRRVANRGREEASALKSETLLTFVSLMAMLEGAAMDNRAQGNGIVNTVITVVVVGVVGIVGILIFAEVDTAITVEGELSESADALGDGFGSAMELLPIVLIVLVASLVIAVIARFR